MLNRDRWHSSRPSSPLRPFALASIVFLVVGSGVSAAAAKAKEVEYKWAHTSREALVDRFAPPPGFRRVPLEQGTFGHWLRHLPVAPKGTPVLAFDGRVLAADAGAVIDIDVGKRDLQQCADSILRLRSEYLFAAGRTEAIRFHFTSGDVSSFSAWAKGVRPKVGKRSVKFVKSAAPDRSHASLQRYLTNLFIYAGTASMEKFMPKATKGATAADIRPGMFFVRGGFPGHAVLVLDVVEDGAGHRRLLLGQGYMPAQSFHVVSGAGGVWFPFDDGARSLSIPTWPAPFALSALRQTEASAAQ